MTKSIARMVVSICLFAAAMQTKANSSDIRIRVTDQKGKPVKSISWIDATLLPGFQESPYLPLTSETAVPNKQSKIQTSDNEEGVFSFSNSALIWAEGTAHLFFQPSAQVPAEPIPVTLHPPAKIVIRVTDINGQPLKGINVANPYYIRWNENTIWHKLPETDENGVVEYSQLSPGIYSFWIARPRIYEGGRDVQTALILPDVITVAVKPGKEYQRSIVFRPVMKGSPESLLQSHMRYLGKDELLGQPVKSLNKKAEEKVAEVAAARLAALPGKEEWEGQPASELAYAIKKLRLRSAVPAVRDAFLRWHVRGLFDDRPGGPSEFVATLAELEGDKVVPLFVKVAKDPSHPPAGRRDAVLGLGLIGTEKSVAAFKELRDSAYAKPGAPPRKESYTHEEKMVESVIMTMSVIPGEDVFGKYIPRSATVEKDYSKGSVSFAEGLTVAVFHMKRYGDEWLVVKISYPPSP